MSCRSRSATRSTRRDPRSIVNPSIEPLRREFGDSVGRALVLCGQTIVYVHRDRVRDILRWLKETPGEDYDFLVDLTAVEYRDAERPLEVVYQLRSLTRNAELRVKVVHVIRYTIQHCSHFHHDI